MESCIDFFFIQHMLWFLQNYKSYMVYAYAVLCLLMLLVLMLVWKKPVKLLLSDSWDNSLYTVQKVFLVYIMVLVLHVELLNGLM